MPPVDSAPPSFYEHAAQIQQGGGGAPSPGTPKGQKNPDSEIIQGLAQMFRILDKMVQLGEKVGKPMLREKLTPARDAIKSALAEVFNVDADKAGSGPEGQQQGPVEGNMSPQGAQPASPPPPDPTAQPA